MNPREFVAFHRVSGKTGISYKEEGEYQAVSYVE
jgi:hypothetical protein